MKYVLVLIGLLLSSVLAVAGEIANLALDPDHGRLNNAGAIEISFDLPDHGSAEEAYLEVTINGTATLIPGAELDDFSATGNTLTLKGEDLYELAGGAIAARRLLAGNDALTGDDDTLLTEQDPLPDEEDIVPDEDAATGGEFGDELLADADAELPDDDAITTDEWPAERDGQYTVSLVVIIDQDSIDDADADMDADAEDDAVPDEDIYLARAPIYGTGAESRESFTVLLDNVPPQEPADATVEGGNRKLIVTVTPPTKDAVGKSGEQVGRYHVLLSGRFLNDGAETDSSLEYVFPVDKSDRDDETHSFTIEGKDGLSLINNDAGNDTYSYTLRIRAEDLAGNTDTTRFVETTGSALTTEGFWTHYKSAGGKEDGGYCFIATAGYGSYTHPHVKVLRAWRDAFLAPTETGRAFIAWYYRAGPMLADRVTALPGARPLAQLLLFPLVILAWLLLHPLVLIALLAAAYIPLRRLRGRCSAAALLCLLALPLAAESNSPGYGIAPEDAQEEEEDKLHGDLVIGGGFYDPSNIDKSAAGNPIAEVLTSDLNFMPTLYGGIDIPAGRYLKLTPHIGVGFVELTGRAIKLDGTRGTERTYLYVLPLMAEVKLRPVYEFPLRPYLAAGFDYYFWWIIEDDHLAMDGGKFGFHGTVGLQISLNFIDPKTAIKLRESTGILDTHLFAHYRIEQVDNFFDKNSFDLSSSRFEFGLMFDF